MVGGSEAGPSNSSASQPKHQGLSRPEDDKAIRLTVKNKRHKETKIPTYSTPNTGVSRPIARKLKFSREDFVKSPTDGPPQSKQEKTGKKHS